MAKGVHRTYPHVDDIADWRAQQTIRLLWDRVFALDDQLRGVLRTQGDLVNTTNAQEDAIGLAHAKANEALAVTQRLSGERVVPGAGAGGGGGSGVPGLFVWAWIDLEAQFGSGGDPPVAPAGSVGAPGTMDEWRDYFFTQLDRTIGDDAPDWEEALLALRDAGMKVNPEPEEIPQASWPFFGIALYIAADGHPRGRIALPSDTPDLLKYYTYTIQVIDNA